MKLRITVILLTLVLGTILLIFGVSAKREADLDALCLEVIHQFGWETEDKPSEVTFIALPISFDSAYWEYEALQNKAGFSLLPYRGRTLTRRTYPVKGRLNTDLHLLLDGQAVVGGDVSNPDLKEGFLLSLLGEP